MREYIFAVCGAILALTVGAGCTSPMRHDPSKFDPQCPAWQEQNRRHDKSAQATAASMGMEAYYEYYMCLEMMSTRIPDSDGMRYFLDNASDFIRFCPDKLRNPRHPKELYTLSSILMTIHVNKYYNVKEDTHLMDTWRDALQRRDRNHSGFNDTLYLKVVLSPY